MGIQVIVEDMKGNELGAFESMRDAHQFITENGLRNDNLFGKEQTCRITYVEDSHMWDAAYKCWVETKIYPCAFDDEDEENRKIKELRPYYGYSNSVRNMLSVYRNKFVVLLKEMGTINEDKAGDDPFITLFYAHNFDWISHYVRSFASCCCGEVAIYEVSRDCDVTRLFKERTINKDKFKVFKEKKYELSVEEWDKVGWTPKAVD